MDKKIFNERVGKLEEVGKIIDKLPAEIRSQAFELIKNYITGAENREPGGAGREEKGDSKEPAESREAFFSQFSHDKPADNAKLLAAFHFQEFGSEAFTVEEIQKLAAEVGLTVPERLDMTFEQAKSDGKGLFHRAGRGQFKPTVHGEAYFRTNYRVRKGTKVKPKTSK